MTQQEQPTLKELIDNSAGKLKNPNDFLTFAKTAQEIISPNDQDLIDIFNVTSLIADAFTNSDSTEFRTELLSEAKSIIMTTRKRTSIKNFGKGFVTGIFMNSVKSIEQEQNPETIPGAVDRATSIIKAGHDLGIEVDFFINELSRSMKEVAEVISLDTTTPEMTRVIIDSISAAQAEIGKISRDNTPLDFSPIIKSIRDRIGISNEPTEEVSHNTASSQQSNKKPNVKNGHTPKFR